MVVADNVGDRDRGFSAEAGQREGSGGRVRRRGRMLRVPVVGLATAAAALLPAGSAASASAATLQQHAQSAKRLRIGFVSGDLTDSYYVTMQFGAAEEAKKLGVTLDYQASLEFGQAAQLTYVNAVLATHPSAFVVDPDTATALLPEVAQAKKEGIPVVTVDARLASTANIVTEVGDSGFTGGQEAARALGSALGHKGTTYIFASNYTSPNDILRINGYRATMKTFKGMKVAGAQYTNAVPSTGASEMEAVMQRYPTLNGVFCADSFSCEGVIDGLQSVGDIGKVKVFGYDAEPVTMKAIAKGWQLGTVAQEPALEGELAVKYAVMAAEGKTAHIPKSVLTPQPLITHADYARTKKWGYITKVPKGA